MELATSLNRIIEKSEKIIELILLLKKENKQKDEQLKLKDEQITMLNQTIAELKDALQKFYEYNAGRIYGRTFENDSR